MCIAVDGKTPYKRACGAQYCIVEGFEPLETDLIVHVDCKESRNSMLSTLHSDPCMACFLCSALFVVSCTVVGLVQVR